MIDSDPNSDDAGPAVGRTQDSADPHCLHCGYNLRGLPVARCPECGTIFDPAEPAVDPSAAWGPLVWESSQPLPVLQRLYHTLVGFILHPLASIRQLGTVPRTFGRAQLLFLPWLLVIAAGMAVVTTVMWKVAYDYLSRFNRSGPPRTLPNVWIECQIRWLDATIATVFNALVVFHLVAVAALLNRDRDTYRELGVLFGLLGAAITCGIVAPAPEAVIPAIIVVAGTAGLVVYEYDRIAWRSVVSRGLRGLTYLAGIVMFVDLYVTIADHLITVLNNRYGPYRIVVHWSDRLLSLLGISLFAILMYVLVRSTFHADRVRAGGVTVVYFVLASMWLQDVYLVQQPLWELAGRLGFDIYP